MSPVLVVDDDDELRELIALHLNASGYPTLEAADGVKALEVVHDGTPLSLMLLDLRMPRMNGLELLERLRVEQALDGIPVVVLTTSSAEADILKSYKLHANCYITKPVDLEQFVNVVRSIDDFWLTVVRLPSERA